MNNCRTCKYFGSPMGVQVYAEDYLDDFETEHHACARIIHGNANMVSARKAAAELAIVTDGSGYAARLLVLPGFGCVLHEEKGT